MQNILQAFNLKDNAVAELFGSGLINHTWKVIADGNEYILQKVNHHVFTKPEDIAHNCRLIADYLKQHHPDYLFVAPMTFGYNDELVYRLDEGYYRLFPFIKGSHAKDIVKTPEQAYEAAKQFGRFTRLLSGIDVSKLKTTIPSFHDLSLRYQQFLLSLKEGNQQRIYEAQGLIEKALCYEEIVKQYQAIKFNPAFTVSGTGALVKKGDTWGDEKRDVLYLKYQVNFGTTTHSFTDTVVMRDRGVKMETFNPVVVN